MTTTREETLRDRASSTVTNPNLTTASVGYGEGGKQSHLNLGHQVSVIFTATAEGDRYNLSYEEAIASLQSIQAAARELEEYYTAQAEMAAREAFEAEAAEAAQIEMQARREAEEAADY